MPAVIGRPRDLVSVSWIERLDGFRVNTQLGSREETSASKHAYGANRRARHDNITGLVQYGVLQWLDGAALMSPWLCTSGRRQLSWTPAKVIVVNLHQIAGSPAWQRCGTSGTFERQLPQAIHSRARSWGALAGINKDANVWKHGAGEFPGRMVSGPALHGNAIGRTNVHQRARRLSWGSRRTSPAPLPPSLVAGTRTVRCPGCLHTRGTR